MKSFVLILTEKYYVVFKNYSCVCIRKTIPNRFDKKITQKLIVEDTRI